MNLLQPCLWLDSAAKSCLRRVHSGWHLKDGARDQFPQLVQQADDFPSGRVGFKALRTQAIARALSVRDIESSVWLP
jgi:hypothetical protein